MGQRRKHVTQSAFSQDIQPPEDGQEIVRALGTRGGNIVEVEYPDGSTTLCMMPAKFNRKLWVRRGGFLVVQPSPDAQQDEGSRVTATITAVLYDEHVKQLKKMPGVWPPEFAPSTAAAPAAVNDLPDTGSSDDDDDDEDEPEAGCAAEPSPSQAHNTDDDGGGTASAGAGPSSAAAAAAAAGERASSQRQAAVGAAQQQRKGDDGSSGEEEDSDDGLPPLQQIHNRREVVYAPSDSDEDSDEEGGS